MRACIELGLHREMPAGVELHDDVDGNETQPMVFWAAYCVDRRICSSLQRPLTAIDSTIGTCLPRQGADAVFLGSI